jgi:hypothetical protein
MGVDLYMKWEGETKTDEEAQFTGYQNAGASGYLRGAYFGGYSDVLRFLFNWADWDEDFPFDPDIFERNLNDLRSQREGGGYARPGKGDWDHTKGDKGWDLSRRQNEPLDEETVKEYEAFLALGRRLIAESKKPMIHVSY